MTLRSGSDPPGLLGVKRTQHNLSLPQTSNARLELRKGLRSFGDPSIIAAWLPEEDHTLKTHVDSEKGSPESDPCPESASIRGSQGPWTLLTRRLEVQKNLEKRSSHFAHLAVAVWSSPAVPSRSPGWTARSASRSETVRGGGPKVSTTPMWGKYAIHGVSWSFEPGVLGGLKNVILGHCLTSPFRGESDGSFLLHGLCSGTVGVASSLAGQRR